jgi:cytochrome d ubiquinol oxidase subunit I
MAFDLMIAIGCSMMLVGILYFVALWKKRSWLSKKWFLNLFILSTPFGFIAVEAGWTVTEVGRQPWIIQGIMRTSEAVTPMPGIHYTFYLFTAIYFTLSLAVIFLLSRQIKMVPELYDRKN